MAQLATFKRPETIGALFVLIDETGTSVTNESFRDRLILLLFGYTHCPDVCPTELASHSRPIDMLGSDADQVAFVFVTLDPDRDTPERLRNFVEMFHPKLKALVGNAAETRSLAAANRVIYKKHQLAGEDYVIDHSSLTWRPPKTSSLADLFVERHSAVLINP